MLYRRAIFVDEMRILCRIIGGSHTIKSYSKLTPSNSKTTMDIYAKVKYNKPEELFGVVNGAFHQAIAE